MNRNKQPEASPLVPGAAYIRYSSDWNERLGVSSLLQDRYSNEPLAVPKTAATLGCLLPHAR